MIGRTSLSHFARIVTPTATSAADPRQWNKKHAVSSKSPVTLRSSPFHSSSLSSSSITAAAQSIVHKHSSSHSSSSSTSSSSSLLALLAAGAIVGGAVIAHDNDSSSLIPSAAASASSPPPTPTLSFQLPGADEEATSTPQKKTEKKASEPLKNPGKFDHPLRDSQMVLAVPVFGGAKFQWAYPYFHPEAEKEISGMMDKQLTSMIVVSLGDPQGSNAMLNVISQLGQTHEMRAMWDTNGSTVGKYKYRGDRFSFKSEFQIAPMYNAIMVGGDYRGDSFTGQAYLLQGQEIELSFMKSVTANIIAGVQLRHVMDQQTLLDYIAKYTTSDGNENIVLSQKMNNLIAAYTRRIDPYCSVATEFRLNQMNHESQCVVGLIYRRPNSFTYQANLHSGGVVSVLCEQTIVPGIIFGVTGAMVHDGSGESQFGFSFTLGG